MKKKSLSMVIVLTLLLAMTNQFVLARDYKEGSSPEYVANFEDDLENRPDINLNQRNYLTADYYQTMAQHSQPIQRCLLAMARQYLMKIQI